jgi:hypothetical protein
MSYFLLRFHCVALAAAKYPLNYIEFRSSVVGSSKGGDSCTSKGRENTLSQAKTYKGNDVSSGVGKYKAIVYKNQRSLRHTYRRFTERAS